jgi:hypothetical protein
MSDIDRPSPKKQKITASNDVISIVLTGGPCGGKTSAIEILRTRLTELGYLVYTVPEVPTILFANGAVYPGEDPSRRQELLILETTILRLQMSMEDSFLNIARSTKKKCVLICDRGVLDCKAYMPPDVWDEVIKLIGIPEQTLMSRYVGICHLVTAAEGAPDFYTIGNNIARTETAETAIELDKKTVLTWNRHPVHEVIHNVGRTFDEKMEVVTSFFMQQIEANIGKPVVN